MVICIIFVNCKNEKNSEALLALCMYKSALHHIKEEKKEDNPNATEKDH